MVGGDEFEKIKGGKKVRPEGEKASAKNKPKRGGKRVIPHADDEPVPFDVPQIPDAGPAIAKDDVRISTETPVVLVEAENATIDGGGERALAESFKEKYGAFLDRDLFNKTGDSIRIVSKFYNANNGKVGVWFNPKEGKPEKWSVPVDELDEYLGDFRPKESKKSRSAAESADRAERKPFNGQFVADEAEAGSKTFDSEGRAYHNGSTPHDSDEALKERPERKGEPEEERVKISKEDWDAAGERLMGELDKASGASKASPAVESAPEDGAEKELDPEDLKDVIDDIEEQWRVIMGVHQDVDDEEDRILILRGTISDYGKKQLESLLGASKKQAKKIVSEVIDKILAR